jgi:molybdopterin synthase catalytic subunit
MTVRVQLTAGRIVEPPSVPITGAGACLEFRGIVRGLEQDRAISALCYEAYEPMALRVMETLVNELAADGPCLAVEVIHRHGTIPVGETAIFLRVQSAHRGEGLRLLESFLTRLKTEVPIWKIGGVPC